MKFLTKSLILGVAAILAMGGFIMATKATVVTTTAGPVELSEEDCRVLKGKATEIIDQIAKIIEEELAKIKEKYGEKSQIYLDAEVFFNTLPRLKEWFNAHLDKCDLTLWLKDKDVETFFDLFGKGKIDSLTQAIWKEAGIIDMLRQLEDLLRFSSYGDQGPFTNTGEIDLHFQRIIMSTFRKLQKRQKQTEEKIKTLNFHKVSGEAGGKVEGGAGEKPAEGTTRP